MCLWQGKPTVQLRTFETPGIQLPSTLSFLRKAGGFLSGVGFGKVVNCGDPTTIANLLKATRSPAREIWVSGPGPVDSTEQKRVDWIMGFIRFGGARQSCGSPQQRRGTRLTAS